MNVNVTVPTKKSAPVWLPYRVVLRGDSWVVYRYEKGEGNFEGGSPVKSFIDRPSAKKEAYKLNGEYFQSGLPF